MNLQTVKPRARRVSYTVGAAMSAYGEAAEKIELWRVTFPGWSVGFCGSTIEGAVELAYKNRLARITGQREEA